MGIETDYVSRRMKNRRDNARCRSVPRANRRTEFIFPAHITGRFGESTLGTNLTNDLLETSRCVSILLAQLWPSISLATLCLNFITRLFLKGLYISPAPQCPNLHHLNPSEYLKNLTTLIIRPHNRPGSFPSLTQTQVNIPLQANFISMSLIYSYYRSLGRQSLGPTSAQEQVS